MSQSDQQMLAALHQLQSSAPGNTIIPTEYQGQRGAQPNLGPMSQAATVEAILPRFVERVGLACDVTRTDSGWVLTITRPTPEVIDDGVEVGP